MRLQSLCCRGQAVHTMPEHVPPCCLWLLQLGGDPSQWQPSAHEPQPHPLCNATAAAARQQLGQCDAEAEAAGETLPRLFREIRHAAAAAAALVVPLWCCSSSRGALHAVECCHGCVVRSWHQLLCVCTVQVLQIQINKCGCGDVQVLQHPGCFQNVQACSRSVMWLTPGHAGMSVSPHNAIQ
jgi:hypothetical protein